MMNKFKQELARVFDDNLRTKQWQNVFDWIIIGLIVVSTVEVFLSTFEGVSHRYGAWLNVVDLFTTLFFTVEVTLRIWCADFIDPKYKGIWGRVRYCFSFYGLVDFLATYRRLVDLHLLHRFLVADSIRCPQSVAYRPSDACVPLPEGVSHPLKSYQQ